MILTYSCMVLLVLVLLFITLYDANMDDAKNSFLDSKDSEFLRGFWCIVVVLVHIPAMYQNRIQDMIGSFAFIGVTFFFMTSSYGLKYSIEHKNRYIDNFWGKRLPSLLVPAVLANCFVVTMRAYNGKSITAWSYINIDAWVKVLLIMYVGFWVICKCGRKYPWCGKFQDWLIVLFVLSCSFIQRFTNMNITYIWIVEPLGFAYGILAAKYSEKINNWFHIKWRQKTVVLNFISLLLGLSYLKYKPIPILGDYFLKILLGMAITAFMLCVLAKLKVGNEFVCFLGGVSYEVYILHHGVFEFLMSFRIQKFDSGMFILLSLVFTVLLATMLKRISDSLINYFFRSEKCLNKN